MGALVSHRKYWQKQRTSSTPTAAARYAIVLKVSCVHGRSTMAFRIEDIELGDDTSLLAGLRLKQRTRFSRRTTSSASQAYVPDAIASVAHLAACCDENGQVVGFIGVDGAMIEMLFIHPSLRGCGLGSLLLDHAVSEHGATLVDVNEQNEPSRRLLRALRLRGVRPLGNRRYGRPLPHPAYAPVPYFPRVSLTTWRA